MRFRFEVLSISRVLFYVVLLSFLITSGGPALTVLCAASLLFYLSTSAVILGWVRAPKGWETACLYAEIAWSTVLATWVAVQAPDGPMPTLFTPLFVSLYLDENMQGKRLKLAVLITALLWTTTLLPHLLQKAPIFVLVEFGIYGAFNLFSAAMGSLARSLRESQAALAEAHQRLQESAARQQQLAVLEERQRLAREIHDSVAHSLTALVVQVQAARRTLDRMPDQVGQRLEECEVTARQALQETRLAVRALHPGGLEQQSDVEALRRLGSDFGAATGMSVTLEADPAVQSLQPDPNRLEQLFRIFQEALTNAHRHGKATAVAGRLSLADGMLGFTIQNDGAAPTDLTPGVGLRSMVERAQSLGGTVAFEPGETGLCIRVKIPVVQQDAAS